MFHISHAKHKRGLGQLCLKKMIFWKIPCSIDLVQQPCFASKARLKFLSASNPILPWHLVHIVASNSNSGFFSHYPFVATKILPLAFLIPHKSCPGVENSS